MVTCQAVVEEENLFVWQQVEGFGTQVNEGLVCEVVKRVSFSGKRKHSQKEKKRKVETEGMMNSKVRSCCMLLSCSNYPLN